MGPVLRMAMVVPVLTPVQSMVPVPALEADAGADPGLVLPMGLEVGLRGMGLVQSMGLVLIRC